MGADIHFFIEKKKRDGKWHLDEMYDVECEVHGGKEYLYITSYMNGGRDYNFFGLLAGVRGSKGKSSPPLRGIPEDACEEIVRYVEDYWEHDAHSKSYCSISEYEAVCDEYTELCENENNPDFSEPWRVVIKHAMDWLSTEAAEAALLEDPYEPEVRFVYFFDN